MTVTVSGVTDDDADVEEPDVNLAASGGGYGAVTAKVDVTVTDAALVVDPAELTVLEGSSNSFTVRLGSQPAGPVTVAVSSSVTDAATVSPTSVMFTTANWDTAVTVTVSGVTDDDADVEEPDVNLAASGGGYGAVTAKVDVTVTDAALVVDPAELTVLEGSSNSFTVRLGSQPAGPVTVAVSSSVTDAATVSPTSVMFTTANWDTAVTVTVSGVTDDDADVEEPDVNLAASGGGYGAVTAKVDVTVTDAALVVDPAELTVLEGSSNSFTVRLGSQPAGPVTVAVSSSVTDAATVSPTSVMFTTANWDTAVTVTVSGVTDDDADVEEPDVNLAASGGGYGAVTAKVDVTVTDAALVVDPAELTVLEGSSNSFTVRLGSQPAGPVTVAVSSSVTDAATVSPTSVMFTTANWATAQTVTVTAEQDDNAVDEEPDVNLAASGGGYAGATAKVDVTLDDDETPVVVVSRTDLALDEGGAAKTYELTLETPPTTEVVVRLRRTGKSVSVSSTQFTFTESNYDTGQVVTLTPLDDADVGNETVTLNHRAYGGEYSAVESDPVTATVTDDDTPTVTVDGTTLVVPEGMTGTYTVVLDARPTAEVTVEITRTGSGDVSTSPTSLRFTDYNWDTAQTVTVTARHDGDDADDEATLIHTASGGGFDSATIDSVAVTVTDDDAIGVTVTPTTLTIDEGSSAEYAVVLDAEPSDTVTVTPSVTGSSDVTVATAALTFTTLNWAIPQQVTVSAASDDDTDADEATVSHSVSGGDYQGLAAPSVTVTAAESATAGVTISPTSLSPAEGTTADYTVVLDAAPSATVTVTLEVSGDEDISVPMTMMTLTFTTADWDTAQTVTVSSVVDADAADDLATVRHTLAGGGYDSVGAPAVVVTVSDPFGPLALDRVQPGDERFRAEWSPVPVRDDRTITGYAIRYRVVSPQNNFPWKNVQADASASSVLVTDLEHFGTTYGNRFLWEAQLRVVTDAGASDWSELIQFRIARPELPRELRVEGANRVLLVFWEPPQNEDLLTVNGKRIRYFVTVTFKPT